AGDPVGAAGATLGGAARDGAEQASVRKGGWGMGDGGRSARVLGAVLTIVALPVMSVPILAEHFYRHNRDNGSIVSSGLERTYLLHVPARYDRSKPTPLVLSFPGAGC